MTASKSPFLSDQHRRELEQESAIDSDVIAAREYETLSGAAQATTRCESD